MSRNKSLIKLLKKLIKQDYLYTDEKLREMKQTLRLAEEEMAEIRARFAGEHGDRHQELVFIGQGLDQDRIEGILDRCLLTDLEFAQGPDSWLDLEDPFPPIEIEAEEVT